MNGERWCFCCYRCDPVRRVFLTKPPDTQKDIPRCGMHGKMTRDRNRPYKPSTVKANLR